MIFILFFFCINIVWAVLNWRDEYDTMIGAIKFTDEITPKSVINIFKCSSLFIADITITGTATAIFGFGGFYGSAMAIFMSNILSVVFFVPKGEAKVILSQYREYKKINP